MSLSASPEKLVNLNERKLSMIYEDENEGVNEGEK
jgi:hypothetical protein